MPEVIPPIIAPYLEQAPGGPSLNLVTSTLSTPAHWVLLRYLYATLSGPIGAERPNNYKSEAGSSSVILVSLLRPRDLWLELGKKIGLDLPSFAKNKKFTYIDGLTPAESDTSSPLPTTFLALPSLESLSSALSHALQDTKTTSTEASEQQAKPIVLIDGLDFMLASQPDIYTTQLQQLLSEILSSSRSLIISCNADTPLLHQRDETASPLEREHASFITAMAHQARLVLQLRGLDTGAARDVTGVLRISHGGQCEDDYEPAAAEGEWLYQCKGDGSVRVWSRGE